jgi:hypothetical protein
MHLNLLFAALLEEQWLIKEVVSTLGYRGRVIGQT